MKLFILVSLLFIIPNDAFTQLVTRKDYDAAFALQMGGEISMLTIWDQPKVSLQPIAGLKMTFPFTRKWFLGSEVNYSQFKYGSQKFNFDMKQIHIPIYLKYMLNSNKSSVLFGFYGSYIFDSNIVEKETLSNIESSDNLGVGVTIGYEYQVVKHFNVMFRLSTGIKELVKNQVFKDEDLLLLQASITLSYDIFRIGDCGCN